MSVIVPAIIPTSRQDLEDKLLRLQGLASCVQVDIVDGVYASPASWPYMKGANIKEEMMSALEALDFLGTLHLEMDLMVEDPETHITPWVNAGANRIVIHAESSRTLPKLLSNIQTTYGHDKDFTPGLLSVGLAIHNATDPSMIEPFLDRVDFVQFMGISSIGKQGQPFDPRVLPKIRAFKKKYPGMQVQVDGGVSLETAPALLSAGVSRLVVGSALWKARDIKEAYRQFTELTTRYGVYT